LGWVTHGRPRLPPLQMTHRDKHSSSNRSDH